MGKQKIHQHVTLLHGLGRTWRSMWLMSRALKKRGYQVHNTGYPSTRFNIQQLASQFLSPAVQRLGSAEQIHVVTHSLGGILVRQYLQDHRLPEGSRIVMLAPPNHGSEVADRLMHWKLYKKLDGPAGQQLGTDNNSIPNQLSPVGHEIGVITGDRGRLLPTSWWIPGDNDGLVSVKSARLAEMKDFLIVHCGHTFIMNHPQVIRQTVSFLESGQFRHHASTAT